VRAEVAVSYDDQRPFYSSDKLISLQDTGNFQAMAPVAERLLDPTERKFIIDGDLVSIHQRSRRDQWILQGVAGADVEIRYDDQGDTILLGAEYFYNDYGYKTSKLYPWLAAAGQFNPLTVGRHYVAVYATMLAPFDWDDTSFILSGLGNLSDLSFLARFDYRVTFLRRISFNAYVTGHFGEPRGAFTFGTAPADLTGAVARYDESVSQLPPAVRANLGLPSADELYNQVGLTPAQAQYVDRGQKVPEVEVGVGLRVQF